MEYVNGDITEREKIVRYNSTHKQKMGYSSATYIYIHSWIQESTGYR